MLLTSLLRSFANSVLPCQNHFHSSPFPISLASKPISLGPVLSNYFLLNLRGCYRPKRVFITGQEESTRPLVGRIRILRACSREREMLMIDKSQEFTDVSPSMKMLCPKTLQVWYMTSLLKVTACSAVPWWWHWSLGTPSSCRHWAQQHNLRISHSPFLAC